MLGNMLNILAKDVVVDCHGNLTVDTSQVQHKRKKSEQEAAELDDQKAFRENIGTSMKSIAVAQLKENLRITTETAAKCEVKSLTEKDVHIKRVYKRLKKEQDEMAYEIRKEIAVMTGQPLKPPPSNKKTDKSGKSGKGNGVDSNGNNNSNTQRTKCYQTTVKRSKRTK